MLNYTSFVRKLRLEKRRHGFRTYLKSHKGLSTVYPMTGIPKLSFQRTNEEND